MKYWRKGTGPLYFYARVDGDDYDSTEYLTLTGEWAPNYRVGDEIRNTGDWDDVTEAQALAEARERATAA